MSEHRILYIGIGFLGMIQQVAVQVTIPVIIKKSGLCTEAGKVESVLCCFFCEAVIFIIDIKLVPAGESVMSAAGCHINIQVSICIYISHGNT